MCQILDQVRFNDLQAKAARLTELHRQHDLGVRTLMDSPERASIVAEMASLITNDDGTEMEELERHLIAALTFDEPVVDDWDVSDDDGDLGSDILADENEFELSLEWNPRA